MSEKIPPFNNKEEFINGDGFVMKKEPVKGFFPKKKLITLPDESLVENIIKKIDEGDFVQWEPGGVEQFEEPRRVVKIIDGYAFIDGGMSGVPVEELRVVEKSVN